MRHFRKYSIFYWLILFVGVFFAVPEIANVVDGQPGGTFSESWWWLFHTNDATAPTWVTWGGRAFAIILGGWLVGHLGFGWWGGPTKTGRLPEESDEQPRGEDAEADEEAP